MLKVCRGFGGRRICG